jgi:hypothetical protein
MTYGSVTVLEIEPDFAFGNVRIGVPSDCENPRRLFRRPKRDEGADPTALPGDAIQPVSIERYRDQTSLLSLLVSFTKRGLESSSGSMLRLSPDAAEAGKEFLSSLRNNKKLPRIAPDDDGNLVMVWAQAAGSLIAVIDGRQVNAISGATTDAADYMAPLPYEGGLIPQALLDRIP